MFFIDPDRYSAFDIVTLIAVLGALAVAFYFLASWVYQWSANSALRPRESFLEDRRRMLHGNVFKTRKEKRLERMEDAELEAYAKDRPKDALAHEILCERLESAERWTEYAQEMEYLLTIARTLALEEVCNRYNRLADIYLANLNRPDKCREMLQAIVARYPKNYQATLARQKLASLGDERAIRGDSA